MFDCMRAFRAASVKPALNVNTIIDNLTGEWQEGPDGEHYLVGGLYHRSAIAGDGNVGKTQLALDIFCAAVVRYFNAKSIVLDTEDSLPASRIEATAARIAELEGLESFLVEEDGMDEDDFTEQHRAMLLDGKTTLMIDKWFDMTLAEVTDYEKKWKANKKLTVSYPWPNINGEYQYVPKPTPTLIDSFTEAPVTSADNVSTADGVDSSKGNTEFMREGAIKGRIISKMPQLLSRGGMFVLMTASFGDKMDMNARPGQPAKRNMTDTPGGKDFKKVSSQFKKLTTNCWIFEMPKVLNENDFPKYPYDDKDNTKGNKDLRVVQFYNARGKNGGSGTRYEFVQSQSKGLQRDLSNYNLILEHPCTARGYGHDGASTQWRTLHMYPDMKFSRTTIRKKIDEDPRFRKALEFTAALKLQFFASRNEKALAWFCTPQELYDDLKKKGYDWDILLDTRSYWMYREWSDGLKPYLSVLDLLKMRATDWKPKWYTKELTPSN